MMIAKNTTIPTARTEVFSTAADSQTSVEIHVLQGERPMAHDNKSLGRFILDGIPPAPRGVPQVEVSFDIDANGILSVTAMDKATSKKQSIRIEGSTNLSKEDIERMKKEAEVHQAEDLKKKELSEAKNLAENLVYQAEKSLTEWGEKIPDELKDKLKQKSDSLKSVKDSQDLEKIKTETRELSVLLQGIGKQMYGSQPGPEQKPENPEEPKS